MWPVKEHFTYEYEYMYEYEGACIPANLWGKRVGRNEGRWMSWRLHPYAYIHDCVVHYITHILEHDR